MSRSWASHPQVDPLPPSTRPLALAGLVLLLAATGTGLMRFTGPPDPGHLPEFPSWGNLEVLARSPNPPLDGVVQIAVLASWAVWIWAAASLIVEVALCVAEHGPARGSAWLLQARAIADRLTLPFARRAVAAAVVIQLAVRPPLPALAYAAEPAALVMPSTVPEHAPAMRLAPLLEEVEPEIAPQEGVIKHVVQRGDTPWSIAARYYGSGEAFDRVIDANIGKQMVDGRIFDRAGLIYPGWVLDVPLPSAVLEEHDGAQWYIVQPGDTLRGIAARLLGSEERHHELFELNVGARLGDNGPELRSPDLIWPGLRLRLPGEVPATPEEPDQPGGASEEEPPTTSTAEPDSPGEMPMPMANPDAIPEAPDATPTPAASVIGASETRAAEPESDTLTPAPTAENVSLPGPVATERSADSVLLDTGVAAAGVGLVGLGLAGGRILRRRRRPTSEQEPPVALEQGFALSDPTLVLGQRLAGASDPAMEIVNRLADSYAEVLEASLSEDERSDVFGHVELVAVPHGQTSTTCVLSAPPIARGHLLRHLEAAVVGAFGETIDVEGLVSHDGDVLIRLAGIDQRRLGLAVLDGSASVQRPWPDPLLVPLALLYDRQMMLANWHALNHVLVAGPLGQAAETVLVGLVSSLIARQSPGDLALVTIASPRGLPSELIAVPHQLTTVVDPADGDTVVRTLEQLRDELNRRAMTGDGARIHVVVVIRELADLRDDAWDLLRPLLAEGPHHQMHVLAASERSAAELVQNCSCLGEFRTRLVLQTADEDASQALLGAPGAEELGPGGQMLVRLEGRAPIRAHGFRVAPDHLARLVTLMRWQPSAGDPPTPATRSNLPEDLDGNDGFLTDDPAATSNAPREGPGAGHESAQHEDARTDTDGAAAAPTVESCGDGTSEGCAPRSTENEAVAATAEVVTASTVSLTEQPRSDLLRQLDAAPLRLRCFGARGVWVGERQIWPSLDAVEDTGWELVVLLGIHPAAGVQTEALADIIWDEETPAEPGTVLRKRRHRLRQELKRLMPELEADPLPTDPKGRVYRLDSSVIASDVHQFVELATWAKSLPRADAINAYEEALALYKDDLLNSVAVPTYPWLYDGVAVATSLRPEYLRLREEVWHHLADLYAAGHEEQELGRAVALYTELTAERPDDDRLWVALLRVQGRRGDSLGLQASLRRLRTALVEIGHGDDPETVRLPSNVQRVLDEIQAQARTLNDSAAD